MQTMSRKWCMPSKHTFTMRPAKEVLDRYIDPTKVWVDPFGGYNSPVEECNDLNPDAPTKYHMEAVDFVQLYETIDGVIFDPPYSPYQLMTSYRESGVDNDKYKGMNAMLYADVKNELADRVKKGGIAISFGWNSNGFGKNRGFELVEVHMLAHGAAHNDTIITVERKI